MNRKKIVLTSIVMIFIFSFSTNTLFAEENKPGELIITLEDGEQGTTKENIFFNLIKVGAIENGIYYQLEQFKNCDIELNEIKTAEQLEQASYKYDLFVKSKSIKGVVKSTDKNGVVKFNNLEEGVYLVNVIDNKNYDNISSFLISIPTFNEVTKNMEYTIKAIPKHESVEVVAVKTDDLITIAPYFLFINISLFLILYLKRGKENEKNI